jgi:uncharacterized damage-inducible protein DinB
LSEILNIVDQLEREFHGDPWHGSPLVSILDGINATQAAAHPVTGAHSIWEIVLHLTGWKTEVRNRVGGAPAGEPPDGDWPEVGPATDERWRQALEALQRAHEALIQTVRALPEDKLHEPTKDLRSGPLGTGVTHYVMLHGVVQHDVYHTGQIALLKKALTS